ncbi:MAG: hypothetical protein ACQ9IQ_03910 [Nitrospirales bacterium]
MMKVQGGKLVALERSDTFYELHEDIQAVGKNVSESQPANLLVFFVKDKGAPLVHPVK